MDSTSSNGACKTVDYSCVNCGRPANHVTQALTAHRQSVASPWALHMANGPLCCSCVGECQVPFPAEEFISVLV